MRRTISTTPTTASKTVLQQLSSGSKINSGADDAAGLSLVDGLQANQTALTQSQTNAQEGVGLLQVADGALSQVTSLLNRAVTLATEASNGTLNSSSGYGCQPGIPVDPVGNLQHRLDDHLQRRRGLQLQHQHLYRRLFVGGLGDRRSQHPLAVFVQRGRYRRRHGLQQRRQQRVHRPVEERHGCDRRRRLCQRHHRRSTSTTWRRGRAAQLFRRPQPSALAPAPTTPTRRRE